MDKCLTDPDLERYHAGDLSAEESAKVRRHLAACDTCRRRDAEFVADHEDIVGQLRGLDETNRTSENETATSPDDVIRLGSTSAVTAPLPGSFPGYEIVRELSHGGQGVVYQAVQAATKRKVAIKILLEGPCASPSARRRFEREIELVAQLKHPNIISIFHSGVTADGRQFYVMDYVRGTPLTQYVRQNKLTLEDALRLFAKVCEAVNHAHQKGVIHRDLKPSNILVDVEGAPRMLDFGLARMVASPEESLVSVTGQVVGTLPYMSPEQTRGNPDEIDTRTDVYALGVLLYEMLTGQYPYPVVGQIAEVLRNIAETEPTPPSRAWTPASGVSGGKKGSKRRPFVASSLGRAVASPIDDEVQTIVLKSLAKERPRRYQSAGELARDIDHYLTGEPIEAKRDSTLYILRKQLRRYRFQVAMAASLVLLILGFAVVMSIQAERNRRLALSERDAKQQAIAAREKAVAAQAQESAQRQKAEENERRAVEAREEADRLAYSVALRQILSRSGRLREGFTTYRAALGTETNTHFNAIMDLTLILNDQKRYDDAVALVRENEQFTRKLAERDPDSAAYTLVFVGRDWLRFVWEAKDAGLSRDAALLAGAAAEVLQEGLELRTRILPANDWRLPHIRSMLGEAMVAHAATSTSLDAPSRAQKLAEAEMLLVEADKELHERAAAIPDDFLQYCLSESNTRLIRLYDAWHAAEPDKGHDAKAAEWRAKLAEWQATTQPAASQPASTQPAS